MNEPTDEQPEVPTRPYGPPKLTGVLWLIIAGQLTFHMIFFHDYRYLGPTIAICVGVTCALAAGILSLIYLRW